MKRWLLLFLLFHAFDCNALDVANFTHRMIANDVQWCKSATGLGIDLIASNACDFRNAQGKDMAQGFSDKAFWLRITLSNSGPVAVNRWLQIGNPRLQEVTLFQRNPDGKWESTEAGIATPASERSIVESYPVLPVVLMPGENKVVFVRIHSIASIDLTPTLWLPERYTLKHQKSVLLQSMSLGGLLITALLASLLFFRQRERIYLYFGGKMLAEATFDASFTGILPAYLWPSDLPYDLRLQAIAACLVAIFFVLFAREFIGDAKRYRKYYAFLYFFAWVFVLITLWACVVDYRSAMKLVWIPTLALFFGGISLYYRAWRDGLRAVGYLLVSILALLAMMIFRFLLMYGGNHYSDSESFGHSWYILLITPPILAAISQRSDAMREALQQARADSTARMKFLAQMSHEFRTPLNTVLGYAELLSRGSRRVSVEEAAGAIRQNSRHLLEMIDDILDHVRGESGQIELRPVAVHWESFLKSIEQKAALMVQNNRFRMIARGALPDTVSVDEFRLQAILNNLISNAERYTRNGEITFLCEGKMEDGDGCLLHFCVEDTGRGIAREEMESIFLPFVRGKAGKSSGIDGTGMGLATARQFAGLMGSELSVESESGKGSRFSFSISCPIGQPVPHRPPIPEHAISRVAHRILVVEDDETSRTMVSMLLSDYGFSVVSASSGEDARRFHDDSIELVITDQLMANGSGWKVLREWQDVPVILLSAIPPERPQGFPSSLNFARVHLKPFNAKNLLRDIGEILSIEWKSMAVEEVEIEFSCPPPELLSPLREMIELGAVSDIDDWAETFQSNHPQYLTFASAISEANHCLDFTKLRRLTAPA